MRDELSPLDRIRDPRLAPLIASASPGWVWSVDAARLLWANPAGAAVFNLPSPAAAIGSTIDPRSTAALQMARLAGTLAPGAPDRLERLRGFGGRMGEALLCSCSRVTLFDGTPAIIVKTTASVGPKLGNDEQARRLLDRIDAAAALFTTDGHLLAATAAAQSLLQGAATLSALGASSLADQAASGILAQGKTSAGSMTLERIGDGTSSMLLAVFSAVSQTELMSPTSKEAAVTATVDAAPPATPETSIVPAQDEMESPAKAASLVSESESLVSEAASPMAETSSQEPVASPQHEQPAPPSVERRPVPQPLRFVWQMDAAMHFTVTSDEFLALVGQRFSSLLGQPWGVIAATLALDPESRVARAIGARDTWSGITVHVPTDASGTVAVELSGLPVFDRERTFQGYRGFGICRDTARLTPAPQIPAAPSITPPIAERAEPPVFIERPALTVVPPSPNVVPFRGAPTPERTPSLTPIERKAFGELANRLTARLRDADADDPTIDSADLAEAPLPSDLSLPEPQPEPAAMFAADEDVAPPPADPNQRDILDRLPVGVLVYRLDNLIYANRAFMEWTGYGHLNELADAGGLDALFVEPGVDVLGQNGARALAITTQRGSQVPVEARLFTTNWDEESALVLMLAQPSPKKGSAEAPSPQSARSNAESDELRAITELAADGIIVADRQGRIVSLNARAESLSSRSNADMIGHPLTDLFAHESERLILEEMARTSVRQEPVTGREMLLRHSALGSIPVSVTIGALGEDRIAAILHDVTNWKKTEDDLVRARTQAETASSAKSDFLAKISHEIRTPLNAIIGFSEVMLEERFGAISNDRYKQYLKDIQVSGSHVIELLNDLLDLSKIEAGKLDLDFASVDLNELTQQCVSLMQAEANRQRIIIRTSLTPGPQTVIADARSIRQIVLNLLSNSIKFTTAGGQVIVSTAINDLGDVVLRVRDTGIGMSENDLAVAMEPFRQINTSGRLGSGGSGLGLPLTKALAEANRATFHIRSAVNDGTLVEVAFRSTPLAAE